MTYALVFAAGLFIGLLGEIRRALRRRRIRGRALRRLALIKSAERVARAERAR